MSDEQRKPPAARASTVDPSGTRLPGLDALVAALGTTRLGLDAEARGRVLASLMASLGPPRATPLDEDPPPEILPGERFRHYRIEHAVEEDSTGTLYEAVDLTLARRVTIKVHTHTLSLSETVEPAYFPALRRLGQLAHENIVAVYSFGWTADHRVYIIMTHLAGEPLSARLQRGSLPWREALAVLVQALHAVQAVHAGGFVHGALGPDAIWLNRLDDGIHVTLLDLGVAALLGPHRVRSPQALRYLAPEQLIGSRGPDPRADIYTLGAIAHEMLRGAPAIAGDTPFSIVTSNLFQAPAELSRDLAIPPKLLAILERMLSKDATRRYDAVSAVLSDLRKAGHGAPTGISAPRPRGGSVVTGPPPFQGGIPGIIARPPPRPAGRRLATMAGAAVALAIIGLGVWRTHVHDETSEADRAAVTMVAAVDPRTRRAAVAIVRALPSARRLALLRQLVVDQDPGVRRAALDAIADVAAQDPDEAIRLYTPLTADTDPVVRARASEQLARLLERSHGVPPPAPPRRDPRQ